MAQVPNQDEIKKAQQVTAKKISDKRSKQKAQGKDFILPEGGASGVIPEAAWKVLKS